MSFTSDERRMARINADSAAHVHASSISCRITREHISASRAAIDRSFRLLGETSRHRPD